MPEWHDTRLCGRCQSYRSYLGFRSHCRICGRSVCSSCTASPAPTAAWLDAPFVRLCRNIPATHMRTMRCCVTCAEQAELDEVDYVWARVLHLPVPEGLSMKPWRAESVPEDADKYLRDRADQVRGTFARLTDAVGAEFACRGFSRSAVEDRLVALDAHRLHAFDLVHGTPKLLTASEAAVRAVPLTFTLIVTLLSRPLACRAIMLAVEQPAILDLLPLVYRLVHPDNAPACRELLTPQQLLCLYLHGPDDEAVARSMQPGARQVADAHLDTVGQLAAIAGAPDHASRATLAEALCRPVVLIVRGERCTVASIGFSCAGILELSCSNSRGADLNVFFLAGVERGLVDAVAFIHWARTCHVFQSMTVLHDRRAFLVMPCSTHTHEALRPTHTYRAGVPHAHSGSGSAAAAAAGRNDTEAARAMWATLQQAEPKSVMLQCVALTFKQTADDKDIDTRRLRFLLDATNQLLVYRTGGEAEAERGSDCGSGTSTDEHGPWSTRVMLQEAVDKVRADSACLMERSREYVFWSTVLVTGKTCTLPPDVRKLLPFSF